MITKPQIDQLEKLTGQLEGIHAELSALSKKSPNDGVNRFKLKFVNAVLTACNELLGTAYMPVGEFEAFDIDDLPSNSDVTFVASQYLQALEKYRSDNISQKTYEEWLYDTEDGEEVIAAPPKKLKK